MIDYRGKEKNFRKSCLEIERESIKSEIEKAVNEMRNYFFDLREFNKKFYKKYKNECDFIWIHMVSNLINGNGNGSRPYLVKKVLLKYCLNSKKIFEYIELYADMLRNIKSNRSDLDHKKFRKEFEDYKKEQLKTNPNYEPIDMLDSNDFYKHIFENYKLILRKVNELYPGCGSFKDYPYINQKDLNESRFIRKRSYLSNETIYSNNPFDHLEICLISMRSWMINL